MKKKKKDFDWLKDVSSLSELVPGTCWSVYNARRNKADIVPYFNAILPLLTKNVADFGTQRDYFEIVKSATTLLNPDKKS